MVMIVRLFRFSGSEFRDGKFRAMTPRIETTRLSEFCWFYLDSARWRGRIKYKQRNTGAEPWRTIGQHPMI